LLLFIAIGTLDEQPGSFTLRRNNSTCPFIKREKNNSKQACSVQLKQSSSIAFSPSRALYKDQI